MTTLDQVKRGQLFRIQQIPDELVRAQAIRLGIAEGSIVTCHEIIPGGPIVIGKNRQEIAIGRRLAREIRIELTTTSDDRAIE
ncbi:FeoA family protein [Heliophilum fasciatum]|uniref:Fe2+ transport system protein FeoA n=1 Tax=Heliophilum fasciatum TaxID=35700 RepID=A0A4R2RP95_9FIRM|nr:FeoA family protein [Heliophilum fasciatum]MCW2279156.1 Fe2+ transport system protein FeoA [Heliophilum fasciatum]TCP61015.1 Fe2+ transport system protein FeoA [Heliophilum fasciatum]